MTAEDYDEFRDMWDSPGNWLLKKFQHDYVNLVIHFGGTSLTLQEIIAVRKALPKYRHMPPGEVRRLLDGRGMIAFKGIHSSEADALVKAVGQANLSFSLERLHVTGYLPIGRTNDMVCLIEDDDLCREICEKMIASGVPVVEDWPSNGNALPDMT